MYYINRDFTCLLTYCPSNHVLTTSLSNLSCANQSSTKITFQISDVLQLTKHYNIYAVLVINHWFIRVNWHIKQIFLSYDNFNHFLVEKTVLDQRIRGFACMRYINPRLIDWLIDWLKLSHCRSHNIVNRAASALWMRVRLRVRPFVTLTSNA